MSRTSQSVRNSCTASSALSIGAPIGRSGGSGVGTSTSLEDNRSSEPAPPSCSDPNLPRMTGDAIDAIDAVPWVGGDDA